MVIPNQLMLGRAHNWLRIHPTARFAPHSEHAGDLHLRSTKRVSLPTSIHRHRRFRLDPHLRWRLVRQSFWKPECSSPPRSLGIIHISLRAFYRLSRWSPEAMKKLIKQPSEIQQNDFLCAIPADADLSSYFCGHPEDATADRIYIQSLAVLLCLRRPRIA